MENRIKFLAKKQRKVANATTGANSGQIDGLANDLGVDNNANVVPIDGCDDEAMKDLVNQMKTVVIDANNLDSIKADLRSTRFYRSKILLDKKTDLLELYPYFFINIDLVCISKLHRNHNELTLQPFTEGFVRVP